MTDAAVTPDNGVLISETWFWLKRRAQYQIRRLTYVGAGLAGLGVFASATGPSIFGQHVLIPALFLSAAFATGACLAVSWEACNRLIDEVDRDHGSELGARSDRAFPRRIQGWYLAGVAGLVVTSITLLVGSWMAVGGGTPACTRVSHSSSRDLSPRSLQHSGHALSRRGDTT